MNNKIYIAMKVSLFMANYRRKLRMGEDIRKKGKVESVMEFVEKMKKVYKEAVAALRKTQEKIKQYTDRSRREIEEWKKGNRVILSTKDLVFKKRPV